MMEIIPIKIPVDAEPGFVSAEFMVPDGAKFVLTLSHGAGAGMNHKFMTALAEVLATINIATLRFNFPFIENKRKRVDSPAVAHNTIAGAIKTVLEKYPGLPLFVILPAVEFAPDTAELTFPWLLPGFCI